MSMKKLSAVAVALCIAVPQTFALWDYFPVIEGGSVEGNIASDGGIKVRYGLSDRLELFSANGDPSIDGGGDYALGMRYQFAPEIFSAFADIGIPATHDGSWTLTPGAQFTANFSETVALGAALYLPLYLNHARWKNDKGIDDGFGLDLCVGVELDVAFSENVLFWFGIDFNYYNLGNAGYPDGVDREVKLTDPGLLVPAVGLTFSKDALSVGTSIRFDFSAQNDKVKESVALVGGVDVGIKF